MLWPSRNFLQYFPIRIQRSPNWRNRDEQHSPTWLDSFFFKIKLKKSIIQLPIVTDTLLNHSFNRPRRDLFKDTHLENVTLGGHKGPYSAPTGAHVFSWFTVHIANNPFIISRCSVNICLRCVHLCEIFSYAAMLKIIVHRDSSATCWAAPVKIFSDVSYIKTNLYMKFCSIIYHSSGHTVAFNGKIYENNLKFFLSINKKN